MIRALAISPNGRTLASGQLLRTLPDMHQRGLLLAFDPSG
jgi:hypothetical protein